jgi:anti-sigma B factor antagonist
MEISIGMDGDVVVVELTGDFVASAAEQFKAQMAKLMEKNFLFVALHLDRVNFMDSSGLGACMGAHKAFAGKKGALVCVKPSDPVAKIFRVTRADQKLTVAPSRLEAVQTLRALAAGRTA